MADKTNSTKPRTRVKTTPSTPPVAERRTALMLRTCHADMTSHGGFVWPESGPVEAPDWSPVAECGHGLHGLLWGAGDYALLSSAYDARWLVVEVDAAGVVDIGGKVKVPRGVVVYCGTSAGALAVLRGARWGLEQIDPVASSTGGAAHASTTGDDAHASTTGGYAHASTTGRDSCACALGYGSRVRSTHGPLVAAWWDGERRRIAVAYPGEGRIEAGVWYRVDKTGRFVRVDEGGAE